MKKYKVYTSDEDVIVGIFDTMEDASQAAMDYANEYGLPIFDLEVEVIEVNTDFDHIKTYEDACRAVGVEPMNEQEMAAAGFRADEMARRKLETITAALNDGWKPDWNDTNQAKYTVWFWIKEQPGQPSAGLAFASTSYAPSGAAAGVGSRLCFKTARAARYAAETFKELYELILVENY